MSFLKNAFLFAAFLALLFLAVFVYIALAQLVESSMPTQLWKNISSLGFMFVGMGVIFATIVKIAGEQ